MERPLPEDRLALRNLPHDQAPVMRQQWRDLLFCHWQIDPQEIASRLPKGIHVDTFNGSAWLGVVPFFMRAIRPCGLPPLPWLSYFMELNVRTYVFDEQGRPGVWFFSLDCNQPLAVWIARTVFHLNYRNAKMSSSREGNTLVYESELLSDGKRQRFAYAPSGPANPANLNSFEFFLVERYLLFSTNRSGQIFTGRVHHTPYLISEALWEVETAMIPSLTSFGQTNRLPDHVCYSRGVDVKIFPLCRSSPEASSNLLP